METPASRVLLLVDDMEANRAILNSIFSSDYTILEAAGGQQALDMIYAHPELDVVLLDLMMPDVDGFEVLRQIRKDETLAGLPVIVATMYDEEENELRALRLGAADFICKPYQPEAVRQRVYNVIHKRNYEAMRLVAERDAVTGIYKEETFCSRTQQLLQKKPQQSYCMVCWELEQFPTFVRLFGEKHAENALQAIARCLRTHLQGIGTYARLRTDIFAACIPQELCSPAYLTTQLQQSLEQLPIHYWPLLHAGVCTVDAGCTNVSYLCRCAYYALETVTEKQGSRLAYYNQRLAEKQKVEQALLEDFPRALKENRFSVCLQPVCTAEGIPELAEARARWQHPLYGCLQAKKFAELLVRNGLIYKMDEQVWEMVCRWQTSQKTAGTPRVPVSVHISGTDFLYMDVAQCWQRLLKKYSLEAKWIWVEISYTPCPYRERQIIQGIKALRQLGLPVMLHNIGGDQVSLATLEKLQLDFLKLDARRWSESLCKEQLPPLLQAISLVAQELKLGMVAKGVETKDQYRMMCQAGCTRLQGKLLAPSMPLDKFSRWMTAQIP